jgi:hypothetical protein
MVGDVFIVYHIVFINNLKWRLIRTKTFSQNKSTLSLGASNNGIAFVELPPSIVKLTVDKNNYMCDRQISNIRRQLFQSNQHYFNWTEDSV